MYSLGNIPSDAPAWLVNELRKLQEAQNSAVDGVVLRTLYAEPKKKDGLVVRADGSTWKPNGTGGRGWWGYDATTATWIQLG